MAALYICKVTTVSKLHGLYFVVIYAYAGGTTLRNVAYWLPSCELFYLALDAIHSDLAKWVLSYSQHSILLATTEVIAVLNLGIPF
jgi:hypothetical protein